MKLIKNSFIYAIAIGLQGSINFLLIPLYTRFLSPSEYGIIGVLTSLINLLVMVYVLSLNAAIIRLYPEYKKNKEKKNHLISSIFIFVIGINMSFTIFFIVTHKVSIDPFLGNISFYPYTFLALLSTTFFAPFILYRTLLQAKQRGTHYGFLSFGYFVLMLSLIFVFLVLLNLKVFGALLAITITNGVFFCIILFVVFVEHPLNINKNVIKESLAYSLPLVPHTFFSWGLLVMNNMLINHFLSTAEVGIYDIGFYIGNIVYLLTVSFNQAFIPWFFDILKNVHQNTNIIGKIPIFAEAAIVIYSYVAMLISIFAKDVLNIFVSPMFESAWEVIPFISFAYVLNGIYFFFVSPLFYNKKYTKYVPLCTGISAFANIVLNILLIPRYGIVGSAVGTLLAVLLSSMLVRIMSYKIEPITFRWKEMYGISFFLFVVSLSIYIIPQDTIVISFLYKIVIISVITFLLRWRYKRYFIILSYFIHNYKKNL